MGMFGAIKKAFGGGGGGISMPDSPMKQPGFGQGLGVMDPTKVAGQMRKQKMLFALGALGEVIKGYAGQDPREAVANMEPAYKRMQEQLQLYKQFGPKKRLDRSRRAGPGFGGPGFGGAGRGGGGPMAA